MGSHRLWQRAQFKQTCVMLDAKQNWHTQFQFERSVFHFSLSPTFARNDKFQTESERHVSRLDVETISMDMYISLSTNDTKKESYVRERGRYARTKRKFQHRNQNSQLVQVSRDTFSEHIDTQHWCEWDIGFFPSRYHNFRTILYLFANKERHNGTVKSQEKKLRFNVRTGILQKCESRLMH